MKERSLFMEELSKKKQYDEIPVLYCKHCLSLKIRNIPIIEDSDYCDDCGSTDIGEGLIEEWDTLYRQRFGHSYLEQY